MHDFVADEHKTRLRRRHEIATPNERGPLRPYGRV
jgi:hypothetical protein